MFGVQMVNEDAIIRPLESQGIKRLYPREYDHKRELKKMNASILVNFLDLLDVLVRCPDTQKREEKCADIAMLFIQMHHLINELRPHQARETIRVTLECQKRTRNQLTSRLIKQIERVNEMVSGCVANIAEGGESPVAQNELDQLRQVIKGIADEASEETGEDDVKINQFDSLMCEIAPIEFLNGNLKKKYYLEKFEYKPTLHKWYIQS